MLPVDLQSAGSDHSSQSKLSGRESDSFTIELERTLEQTQQDVASRVEPGEARTWEIAKSMVAKFKPVPFVIWRLSNYVFGTAGQVNRISEGMVFGLKKLILAAASDEVMGEGKKVLDQRKALEIVPSDALAATAVIYAVCRRLGNMDFERIWRPILEDALLRARIGWELGMLSAHFDPGRAMLAGFAGRSGLALQIATGKLEQARRSLELLATGAEIKEVGLRLYGCEPLQVSAMLLSASGCGRDAAFGTVSFATNEIVQIENDEQRKWLAAFTVCEFAREGKIDLALEDTWRVLGVSDASIEAFGITAKKIVRRGHGWDWMGR